MNNDEAMALEKAIWEEIIECRERDRMTHDEAMTLAKEIHDAALPDLELLNILEGGLPGEPRQSVVRCRYSGPEKWLHGSGLVPGMTLVLMNKASWELVRSILVTPMP